MEYACSLVHILPLFAVAVCGCGCSSQPTFSLKGPKLTACVRLPIVQPHHQPLPRHQHQNRYDRARNRAEPRWETVWSRAKLHLVWDRYGNDNTQCVCFACTRFLRVLSV